MLRNSSLDMLCKSGGWLFFDVFGCAMRVFGLSWRSWLDSDVAADMVKWLMECNGGVKTGVLKDLLGWDDAGDEGC